jgi:hypothetical protein
MRHTLIAASAICLTGFSCITGNAQQVVDVDNNDFFGNNHQTALNTTKGLIYQPDKFVRVSTGSPFFKGQWFSARLFDADNNSYSCPSVRLDLLDNAVNFLDAAGTERIVTSPVKKMQLTDTVSGVHYLFVLGDQIPEADKSEAHTWLQLLVNDRVSLCRQQKKSIHDNITYATATTDEDILTFDIYFVRMNKTFTRVKSWQDFVQLFADKNDAVDQFVHTHHLKGKSEDDYVQLVRFYNSLNNS